MKQTGLQTFEYQPLSKPDHIRLLTLHPAQNRVNTVICGISESPIVGDAQYIALSYSWATHDGDASAAQSILLDGKPMPVTQNLHDALRRLRRTDDSQQLWVDAVCINQRDNAEKSTQVSMMGSIYTAAKYVVAWLGEGTSEREDEAAFTAMSCIIADRSILPSWSPNGQLLRLKHTWLMLGPGQPEVDVCEICANWTAAHLECLHEKYLDMSPQLPELRRALLTLLRRRYWTRRWILQEINLVSDDRMTFRWGPYVLSRRDFTTGQDVPFRGLPSSLFQPRHVLHGSRGSTPVVELIGRANAAECADPRDRVFALLNLAVDVGIRPDYGLSTANVYTAFARLLVTEERTVTLLRSCSGCQADRQESDDIKIPSWVPDLRNSFQPHNDDDQRWRDSGGVERCQVSVSHDNILTCCLYFVGLLGEPTQDDKNFYITVANPGDDRIVGDVKIYRHGGLRAPQASDLLCSLDRPLRYQTDTGPRGSVSGLMLRKIGGAQYEERWRIINPFFMVYRNPEDLPWQLRTCHIS